MLTVPAQRMDILKDEPVQDVNITFAFGKANETVYVNIDGNTKPGQDYVPVQQYTVKFSDFENVTQAWADGDDDTDYDEIPPVVRAICELHGDGRITSEEKRRLLAAL